MILAGVQLSQLRLKFFYLFADTPDILLDKYMLLFKARECKVYFLRFP